MGLIVERTPGPDFRQSAKPADVTQGNVWFNPASLRNSMADGVDYWGPAALGTAGYCVGGVGVSGLVATIDKVLFSTDQFSLLATSLSQVRGSTSSFSSLLSGYAAGGYTSTYASSIEKVTFIGDVVSTMSTTLTSVRDTVYSGINSREAGYVVGGIYDGTLTPRTTTDRLLFSTENVATITSAMVTTRYAHSGNESSTAGYINGGFINSPTTYYTRIDKLTFAGESITQLLSGITTATRSMASFSAPSAGYSAGGNDAVPAGRSDIYKLTFSSESVAKIASVISVVTANAGGCNSTKNGYYMGGLNMSNNPITNCDRLFFTTDAVTSLAVGLSVARRPYSGLENLS